jgi:hypothetical protein
MTFCPALLHDENIFTGKLTAMSQDQKQHHWKSTAFFYTMQIHTHECTCCVRVHQQSLLKTSVALGNVATCSSFKPDSVCAPQMCKPTCLLLPGTKWPALTSVPALCPPTCRMPCARCSSSKAALPLSQHVSVLARTVLAKSRHVNNGALDFDLHVE